MASKRKLGPRGGARAPTGFAYSMSCKACVLADRGEFDESDALIEEATAAMEGSGNPVEGSVHSYGAIALLYRGQWKECLEEAEFVRRKGEQVNGPFLCGRMRRVAARPAGAHDDHIVIAPFGLDRHCRPSPSIRGPMPPAPERSPIRPPPKLGSSAKNLKCAE